MELKCARCGELMSEKKNMIQHINYLGNIGPRRDICEACFNSFVCWLAYGSPVNDRN